MISVRALKPLTALLLVVAASACAGNRAPSGGPGAPSAAAAVEQFLQLAAEERYVDMGWVFGTDAGPVMRQWPRPEVEQRMYAIAKVLVHDSYVVGPSSAVPGRIGQAERFTVTLQTATRMVEVPFTVVRGDGRWYVEQVDLQAVTSV